MVSKRFWNLYTSIAMVLSYSAYAFVPKSIRAVSGDLSCILGPCPDPFSHQLDRLRLKGELNDNCRENLEQQEWSNEGSDNTTEVVVKVEDLPWFDFSYVQESAFRDSTSAKPLPLFTYSLVFVTSVLVTVYLYFVGIFGLPPELPSDPL
jgi:hypothetical protein